MATEKRLIDANALGRDAFHIEQYGKGIRCVVDWDDIEAAPTVEAVEVVHGYWKYEPYEFGYKKDIKCSECYCYVEIETDYCPYCGAKMDLKGE